MLSRDNLIRCTQLWRLWRWWAESILFTDQTPLKKKKNDLWHNTSDVEQICKQYVGTSYVVVINSISSALFSSSKKSFRAIVALALTQMHRRYRAPLSVSFDGGKIVRGGGTAQHHISTNSSGPLQCRTSNDVIEHFASPLARLHSTAAVAHQCLLFSFFCCEIC